MLYDLSLSKFRLSMVHVPQTMLYIKKGTVNLDCVNDANTLCLYNGDLEKVPRAFMEIKGIELFITHIQFIDVMLYAKRLERPNIQEA